MYVYKIKVVNRGGRQYSQQDHVLPPPNLSIQIRGVLISIQTKKRKTT